MIVPVALLLVAIGMLDDTGSKGPDAVEVVVDAGIIGAPFMDVWISWMICAIRFWSEFNCAWSEAMVGPLAADAARQLDVLRHDGDSLGVNGAQVGVFEKSGQKII